MDATQVPVVQSQLRPGPNGHGTPLGGRPSRQGGRWLELSAVAGGGAVVLSGVCFGWFGLIPAVAALAILSGLASVSLVFRVARRLEAQLAATEGRLDVLQEASDRLALALEVSQMGTFDVDVVNDHIKWSKYHELLFGFREGEFDGGVETFRRRIHPDDLERALRCFAEAQKTFEPYTLEYRAVWPDGSVHWILARGRFFADAQGQPVRGIGIIVESTDRKQAERDLLDARDRAEVATKAKSAFLANTSHELRTPLTAVLGFSELLLMSETLAPGDRALVEPIKRNGDHLLKIIDDILDLSRIEAGKLKIEPQPVSLRTLLADVATIFRDRAAEKGLDFELSVVPSVPEVVSTDPLRFRQVLYNLLGNAFKFTDRGAVTIHVFTNWSCEGPTASRRLLVIRIEDTGIGMTPEVQRQLFRPFARADDVSSRRFQGTGLGLCIAQKLANALGGDVKLAASAPAEAAPLRSRLTRMPGLRRATRRPLPSLSTPRLASSCRFATLKSSWWRTRPTFGRCSATS